MRRILQQRTIDLLRKYGSYTAVSTLVLGGLAFKAMTSNASSSEALNGQQIELVQATAAARSQQRNEQTRQVRSENYDLSQFPVSDKTEKHWRNILWTTAVVEPAEPFVATALDQILSMMSLSGLSQGQMRIIDAATKVATQLYLRNRTLYSQLEQRFTQAIEQSSDPEWVAVSLSALAKGGTSLQQLQGLTERVKARFPAWTNNVYLYTTIREVAETLAPSPEPPLSDLLNWEITPGQLQLYIICQPDRDVLCTSVLKDRDGKFVRRNNNQLWSVPLLLRSIHNLSWNFVRGQTPQGIYRIEGSVPQPDDEFFRAYGKFSLVNLYVPFESGVKQFLPGKPGPFKGNVKDYQALLPPSWRNYWAIQQSYWAGKAGRSDFRIHGTGEAPDFFSNKGKNPNAFNWNPTIGCLSALEVYNDKGQLMEADMPEILSTLQMVGGKKFSGYMVVVEVPGQPGQSIALETIDAAIRQGKQALRASGARIAANPITNSKSKPNLKLATFTLTDRVQTALIGRNTPDLKTVPLKDLDIALPQARSFPSPGSKPGSPQANPPTQQTEKLVQPPLAY